MKKLMSLALGLSLMSCAVVDRVRGPSPDIPPPAPFKIRAFDTQTLKNGMTILWIEDKSLPYISLQMMIRSGSSQDPAGKDGVAGFTASLLEKGTTRRNAERISEDLEQIGSDFSVSVEPDYTVASISSLSFDKDNALSQFRELLLTPAFPAPEIERHRKQVLGGLQKLADRAEDFSEYLMPGFLFGAHPYGHESSGSIKSIRALRRIEIIKFYNANYVPSNAVLAVTGQFEPEWKAKVAKAFEGWASRPLKPREVPDFPVWSGVETLLVDRPDLNQAQIQIGFKGVPRNIPEYLELRAALKVLGESFGSRLFEEIRVRRGLTYHIRSWFDPRLKAGPMGIYTFTRVDKVGETIDETLKTYRQFVKDGVTNSEVDTVKALMKGQFPRTFETPEALARQLLILNRYDVPATFLTNYLQTLEAMNRDTINATIRKYFDPENLRILVYAPRGKAEEPLKKIGKLSVREYKEFLR